MMKVYEVQGISTLLNGLNNGYSISNSNLYELANLEQHIENIKNYCIEVINTGGIDTSVLIGTERILTEGDLQSRLVSLLMYGINHHQTINNPKVHLELSDRININEVYCDGLIEDGEIGNYVRRTDITYNFSGLYCEESGIAKGFTLNGKHIDIEIKHMKKGYSSELLKSIKKDLCKLKSLLHPEIMQPNMGANHPNANTPPDIIIEGAVVFGIMVVSFKNLVLLQKYLDEGLRDSLINFNQLNNVATLLLYKG